MRPAENIEDFFKIANLYNAVLCEASISYFSIRDGSHFRLVRGRLFYNNGPSGTSFSHFESENILAGHFKMSEAYEYPQDVVADLQKGVFKTPRGELIFNIEDNGAGLSYMPFHPEGIQNQSRVDLLSITGKSNYDVLKQPFLDWELKAALTPYDGVQELLHVYRLGPQLGDYSVFEVVAMNMIAVDLTVSRVTGNKATIGVLAAQGLSKPDINLGYKVIVNGNVVASRSRINGDDMTWEIADDAERGTAVISVPPASVIQCFGSYRGIAQSYAWVVDNSAAQNPRRAVFEVFDEGLELLHDFLTKPPGKGNARDLETGVAWLFWLLGFATAHLGGTKKTQDAADLLVTTPSGHYAVIECTTGLLKTDNKLPLLISRAAAVVACLEKSNNRHLRVLPVMVTSKPREEIKADLEQAQKLGVLVLTREDLEQTMIRTLLLPDPEKIYEEADEAVRSSQGQQAAL